MKSWKVAAALMIAFGSVVGCDDKSADDKKPTAATPGASPSIMDKTMDKMNEAGTAAKEKAIEVKDTTISTATDMKNTAADKMAGMKNSAVGTASDAQASLVAQAQQYYDKAKEYINSNNFSGASDMVQKLQSIKSQLPVEWSAKIDDLSSMLSKAKANITNALPTTMPKF